MVFASTTVEALRQAQGDDPANVRLAESQTKQMTEIFREVLFVEKNDLTDPQREHLSASLARSLRSPDLKPRIKDPDPTEARQRLADLLRSQGLEVAPVRQTATADPPPVAPPKPEVVPNRAISPAAKRLRLVSELPAWAGS